MLFLLLYLHSALGQDIPDRLMLKGGENPCIGRVDIHDKGEWKHVGNKGWTTTNSQVVCKSLRCGDVKDTTTGYIDDRNLHESIWAQNLQCSGKEKNLWECGYDDKTPALPNQHVYVNCSKRPTLTLDGKNRCAGFVQLSTDGDYTLCAGDSDKKKIAERVCKELNCGEPTLSPNLLVWEQQSRKKQKYNCVGELLNETSLWQCIDWSSPGTCGEPVSVTCSNHFHFRLRGRKSSLCSGDLEVFGSGNRWENVSSESFDKNFTNWSSNAICDQMDCGKTGSKTNGMSGNVSLSCSDNVAMALEGGTCHGTIYLQRNSTGKMEVCDADEKIGQLACKEMDCGTFIETYPGSISNGWKLSCEDHAESLWHCQRRSQTSCRPNKAAIICSGSYKVRLRDGLDKCSGRVEVQYKGSWRKVLKTDQWDKALSDRVCADLQCGESHRHDTGIFIDGTDNGLQPLQLTKRCTSKVHILKCLTESRSQPQNKAFINVICKGHHLFFVKGNSHCSGTVNVEQAGKIYSLSGEPKSWDDAAAQHICERMHCGALSSRLGSERQATGHLMQLSLRPNDTSGRRYTLQQVSADNTTVATVKCTGNITVMLKNNNKAKEGSKEATKDKCWGYVEVCRGGECGGVCKDVWTQKHSEILCANLSCGRPVDIQPTRPPKRTSSKMTFSSIHCPASDSMSNLTGCTGVLYDGSCTEAAYVTCAGSLMAKLDDPRDKCAGNATVYLEGQWLPLCGSVEKDVQNSVCKDVGCGEASSLTMTTPETLDQSPQGLSVTCEKGSMSMESCTTISSTKCSTVARIKCSSWRRMVVFDRNSYCNGPVFVKTESNLFPVPSHTWRENSSEVNSLCRNLGCSGPGMKNSTSTLFEQWWDKTYSCKESQNIWECEREAQMKQHQHQQLWVHCEGQKQVTLSDKCHGEVLIGSEKVCSNGWTDKMSELVCDKLSCGRQYPFEENISPSEKLRQFDCTGQEARLMQCASWTPEVCSGGQAVSVMCRDAFNFNLTHQCGGQIQVFQHGKWQPACVDKNGGELLCQSLNCGKANSSKRHYGKPESRKRGIQTVLSCQGQTELKHCVRRAPCDGGYQEELYCERFVDIFPPPELPINLIVGVTVGLLLLVIIIVLVLWQRKRITKLLRGLSRTTTTIASEDIEQPEIVSLKDGIEMRLQNQANGREKVPDSQSQVSSEYDDVGEDSQTEVPSPVASQDEDAPPLPERDMEQDGEGNADDDDDDDDDDGEGYDDVAEPEAPIEEEEEEEERRALPPSPLQETRPLLEEEEDYIEPDDDP